MPPIGADKSIKRQALFALIPAYGFLIVLFYGVAEIKERRGLLAACMYYLLCALLFAAVFVPFVIVLIIVEMPWQGSVAFAVCGGVIILWGLAYAVLGVETAFLRKAQKAESPAPEE